MHTQGRECARPEKGQLVLASRCWHGQLLAGSLGWLAGCQAFVGDYTADLDQGQVVQVSPLCEVEAEAFVMPLDWDSNDSFDGLVPYYAEANPDLIEHLQQVAQAHVDGEDHRGITYLRGAAGVGKSFATNNLTDTIAEDDQCTAEVSDIFGLSAEVLGFSVTLQPDLETLDRDVVFNTLPGVEDPQQFEIEKLFEAMGCISDTLAPLVILDGIDEVHPDTSRLILEALDDYILQGAPGAGPFVHVLVSGRPEGFAGWLTAPERRQANVELVDQFALEAPRYDSRGDLAYRVRGYLEFARDPAPSDEEVTAHIESFTRALMSYGFLSYSIGNLAVGNIIIDQTAPDLEVSERSLKEAVFDDILLRNVETHGRPGAESEQEVSYRRLLEDVATRYAEVDSQGRFSVRSEDQLEVFDEEGSSIGHVRARNLLNRSGLAFLTEPNSATTRYTFEPFWLHAHLIERANSRKARSYEYRGCE